MHLPQVISLRVWDHFYASFDKPQKKRREKKRNEEKKWKKDKKIKWVFKGNSVGKGYILWKKRNVSLSEKKFPTSFCLCHSGLILPHTKRKISFFLLRRIWICNFHRKINSNAWLIFKYYSSFKSVNYLYHHLTSLAEYWPKLVCQF